MVKRIKTRLKSLSVLNFELKKSMSTVQACLNKCNYMQASYVHTSVEQAYMVSVCYRLALQEKTKP